MNPVRQLFYLCPDNDTPSGGIRVIYQHVDILRRHGYRAFVVHERQGFRCSWFRNETPVLGWSSRVHGADASVLAKARRHVRRGLRSPSPDTVFLHFQEPPSFSVGSNDVVVVPEMFGPRLAEIAPGAPKIIFNQNVYFMFKGYPKDPRIVSFPYRHADVAAAFVVSEDSQVLLEYTFPGINVHRVRWSIDSKIFYPGEQKARRIAYMTRRGGADAMHVLTTLAARGSLDGYDIAPLTGLDEDRVATSLRASLIFLSLGYHEGLPRPPAEAMACGAIVVGYDGFGGHEYMLPEFAFPVPTGDLKAFADTLERVLTMNDETPEQLRERAANAAAFIGSHYSPRREEDELLEAWGAVLDSV
jgi:Glycosyl transferases group 1